MRSFVTTYSSSNVIVVSSKNQAENHLKLYYQVKTVLTVNLPGIQESKPGLRVWKLVVVQL